MKLHFTFISVLSFFFTFFFTSILSANNRFDSLSFNSIDCDITGNVFIQQINCHGADNGSLTLDIMGGIPPYTYLWSNGGTTETITDLSAGIYSVTVTDADNCTFELSIELTAPSFLFANVSTNTASSAGANDGNATASPYGGISPYTYQWNDASNSTSAAINNLAVGDYTVTVTDANNCTSIQTITINPFGCSVTVVNTISQITCIGDCDGLSGALVGNGIPPYIYEWNTGESSANISGLCEGIYVVTVTDNNGCNQQNEVVIVEPALLEVEVVNVINIGCLGDNEGVITVQGIGGRSPYHYIWSNGEEENTIDSLAIGTYTVTVTGRGDCFAVMSIDIIQVPALELTVDVLNPISCSGDDFGMASATATGGVASYSFDWSNGATGGIVDSLITGAYTVTVTDEVGCTVEINFEITPAGAPEVAAIETGNVSCFGEADGFANLEVTGDVSNYFYAWSTGALGNTIDGLVAGLYTVTVTDTIGCATQLNINITQPATLEVSITESNQVSCFGESNGAIEIDVTGGTATYDYLWSNGSIENNINDLVAATYTVTVTDAHNCTEEISFEIAAPAALELSLIDMNNVTCFGESNGFLNVQATGGTEAYDYLWSTGSTGSMIENLAAAVYSVTVIDENNCETNIALEVTSPNELLLSLGSITNISCFGENDGTIEVAASGGVTPFVITWSNGMTGAIIDGLNAEDYTAIITDGNACTNEITVTVIEPQILELSIESISNITCGGNLGAATVIASGGTGEYSYMWSNGMTSNEVSDLPTGSYTVSVFDENNCSASVNLDILMGNDNEAPTVLTQTAEVFLNEDGFAPLAINQVDNGSFDNCEIAIIVLSDTIFDCSHLGKNMVTLSITDIAGNIAQAEVVVTVIDSIIPQMTCSDDIMQEGCELTVNYPFPVLSDNCSIQGQLSLETGFVSGVTFPIGVTTVSYSYTDGSDNVSTCSFDVTVSSVLAIDYTIEHVSCYGESNGSISVFDNPNYTYSWENGSTTAYIQNLSPAVYNLTVTDDEACEATLSFEILTPAPLGINVEFVTHEVNGNSDGTIDITATGGVGPYTYEWYFNGDIFSITGDLLALSAGNYVLIVTDKNGCEFTSDVIVVESVTRVDQTELNSEIKIFPTPATYTLFVHLEETIQGKLKLQLVNAQGQLVSTQIKNAKETIGLNVENLSTGIYFLMIESKKGNWVEKVLVQR